MLKLPLELLFRACRSQLKQLSSGVQAELKRPGTVKAAHAVATLPLELRARRLTLSKTYEIIERLTYIYIYNYIYLFFLIRAYYCTSVELCLQPTEALGQLLLHHLDLLISDSKHDISLDQSTIVRSWAPALSNLPASVSRPLKKLGRVTSGAQSSKASSFSLCFFLGILESLD